MTPTVGAKPDTQSHVLKTEDQVAIERMAASLVADSKTESVRESVARFWLEEKKPNDELKALFAAEFEQVAFCSAMNVFNCDPDAPKIHAFGRFEHSTSGLRIPATKSAHPCADYVYRFIPVNANNHYVVEGTVPLRAPAAFEFGVIDGQHRYQGTLSAHQLMTNGNGRFSITISPDPAKGRPNHIQTSAGACRVIIRDVLGDVALEKPYDLKVHCVARGIDAQKASVDPIERFGFELRKFVDDLLAADRVGMSFTQGVPNLFKSPVLHGGGMLLVTQAYSPGCFHLRDNEAIVFTLDPGNAAYAVIPVTNWWGGIGDFLNHTSQWGTGRAQPNPDGTYTFVLSLADPGVHNWVDPAGLHEGVVYSRWVGFDPDGRPDKPPTLDAQLIPFQDIGHVVPAQCPEITPAERAQQLLQHRAAYSTALGWND
jgi:hypothetical protein